jgi:hypothetical protein
MLKDSAWLHPLQPEVFSEVIFYDAQKSTF